ncbi:MAG: tetratricopeptide repeat protein, partial [Flavobacteriales bacterium]|nr:tetratricopeptide repeat protein [Flavobacteriales bacterium]
MKKFLSFIFLLLFVTSVTVAQSYFKDYKSGEQNFSEQKYTEAIENFTNVIAAKNDHDRAYNYRGLCYFHTNNYEKAVADFKKAVELKEKSDEYHLNHGKALMALNKNDEAIVAFDISIDRNKKQTEAYQAKIQAQMQAKRFMDAVATAEQLLSIDKNGMSYYLLGVAQDSSKLFKESAYSFDRAKFYDAKLVGAYIGLAHT